MEFRLAELERQNPRFAAKVDILVALYLRFTELVGPVFDQRAHDRVRLACALGALMSGLYSSRSFANLGPAAYGDLLPEAISDLLG